MTDARALARDERAEFAAFLAGLTPEQWDAPSLCADWTVRDVVAHVVGYDPLGVGGFVATLVRARFDADRANQRVIDDHRDADPALLVDLVRRYETPQGLTALFGARIALVDGTIHHQDIRRPLGLPREIPDERLRAALDFAVWAPPIGNPLRVRGLRLVATDVDWASGRGPEVRGPGEAVLLAAAGRAAVLDELDGPGVATLAQRCGAA